MGRRPEIAWYVFAFCKYSFINTGDRTNRWQKWKVRFYVCLGVTKLHPSVTLTSGYTVEGKFCPELHAELTGGGSVYLEAELGSRSLEVLAGGCFARQKHSQVLVASFLGAQHPPDAQGPGSSRDLDLHHLSHWWLKHWLCQEYIHITWGFFSLTASICVFLTTLTTPCRCFGWGRVSAVPCVTTNLEQF